MKGSVHFPTLLLLLLLLDTAQGIRLQPVAMPSTSQEIHDIKGVRRFKDGGIGRVGGIVLCEGGECSGRSRKLLMMTNAKSMSKKIRKEGAETEGAPSQYHSSKEIDGNQDHNRSLKSTVSPLPVSRAEHHPDIMDLAAMDYAFVRKRTPIHN